MNNNPVIDRRALLRGTAAAGFVTLLTGCGVGTGSKDSSSATKKEIDTLKVAFGSSISTLLPGKEAGVVNYYVSSLVLEGLVAPGTDGKLVGALAKSWEQTSPTTYVYDLRDDAKFSDGQPLTVDDVLYSIDLAKDAKLVPQTASYWANVTSATKTGERQVTITLASPDVSFAWVPSAAYALWITAKRYVDAQGGQIGTPKALAVGTGPYKFTSFTTDSGVRLERVDTWWGGPVRTKAVQISFIPDESTRVLARRSGDIDIAVGISLDQLAQWKSVPSTKVVFTPDRSYAGIDFNTSVAPFDDVHVRRAIAYAVDRKTIVTSILRGHGEVATALTTPDQLVAAFGAKGARDRLDKVLDLDFDLDKAKAELAQSKVPDGFATSIAISSTAPEINLAFQALSDNLKKLGITLDIKEVPTEQWLAGIGEKDQPFGYMWYFNGTGDPAELPGWFLGEGNPAAYTNAEVTALLESAKSETDPAKRAQLILDAQQKALQDLPYVPLWWGQTAYALADSLHIDGLGSYTLLSPWTPRITEKA